MYYIQKIKNIICLKLLTPSPPEKVIILKYFTFNNHFVLTIPKINYNIILIKIVLSFLI